MKSIGAACLLLATVPVCGGEFTGRFTLNEKPAAAITVTAVPLETSIEEARREARGGPRPEAIGKAVSNAKGEWRIVFEVPPGKAGRIVVFHYAGPGVQQGTMPQHGDTADSEDVAETALRKGVTLTGLVVDAESRPVADADVGHPTGPGSVRTDADGRFALDGVPEASNSLLVHKTGFAVALRADVRAGALPKPVVLRPGLPLAGVVVSADGKTPVPGAVVRVEGKDASTSAETDAEGRFSIRELGAGRVLVAVDGGERGTREVTGVAIPQPPETLLTLVLAPAPELRGRVIDAVARKGVAGAFVEAVSGRRRLWARSGADGSFVVRPAPAGDWAIQVAAPRYVRTMRRLSRAEFAGKPVEILVREGATIVGRVTDDQRRPVAGARMKTAEEGTRVLAPAAFSVTGDDGTFTLRRVAPVESLRVIAMHPDFETASIGDFGLRPGETRAGVAFSLRRGAILTGVVTAGDAPAAGVPVTVSPGRAAPGSPPRSLAGPGWSWPRATTGTDGRFRIGGLAPGEYSVTAAKPGYARETRDVVIAEGRGPEPLAFALESEAVITGAVRGKKGSGVPDVNILAMAADSTLRSGMGARTLADGSFRIEGLKSGVSYNLFLYGIGGSNGPRKTLTAPGDGVEITSTGSGRVAGRVVDADGRPVPSFQVSLQTDRTSGGTTWVTPVRQDVSSETGEFLLENVPATALELRVLAKGYQPARMGGIAVEEGETRSGVEVRLLRGATVLGRVVEARSGRSLPEIEVSAESAPASVTTGSDGAFTLEGLAQGKTRVTAKGPEYAAASEIVEVGESGGTVEIKLSSGASISAVVVAQGGEPLAGAEASLAAGGQNNYAYGGTKATSGPDGRIQFTHLAPGRYSLTAGSAGRRSRPVEVTVEADQARDDVRVVVGGGATVIATVTGLSPDERRQLSVMVSGPGLYASAKELPDGRFEVRDVVPGPAQAYARVGSSGDPGGRAVNRPLKIPEDGTVDVELPFEAGFTLTVRVVRDGQGIEGTNVYASPVSGQTGTNSSAVTDASGSCRLTGLKAGAYRVMAYSMSGSGSAPEQKIDLSGDRSLEFVIPSGRLAGRVVSSGSLQPLSDAYVSIRTTNADGSFGLTHDATTDDSGRFLLLGLEAGPLTLTAQRKGYLVEKKSVSADVPDEIVVELARGEGLDVLGRDGLLGTPLGSFSVRILDGTGAEIVSSYVRLDSAGRGEIPSLKPGAYGIVATASGLAPASYENVPVPGPTLVVALTPGGTLDVEVPAERLKGAALKCLVAGPRGAPLFFRQWGNRGELSIGVASV
ncbi:MAG: carboxypeptidase regulatory-like domain-containing protein, partial [Acidobacteriota bacterium]